MKPLFVVLLLCLPAMAQHTYYISKVSCSDSNTTTQAQSKTTPWCHHPYMGGATGVSAGYSGVAGDQFILKGGDTWNSTDMAGGFHMRFSSAGAAIYTGVDKTWFTGGSWVRPKFDCQNTACVSAATNNNVMWMDGAHNTIDNIEITGYHYANGQSGYIGTYQNFEIVQNMYIHGATIAGGSCGAGSTNPAGISMGWSNFPGEGTGVEFDNNVIDFSDNSDVVGGLDWCFLGILHGNKVQGNVIRFAYNGMNGLFSIINGNLIENNHLAASGDHCNMMYPQNTFPAGFLGANTLQISNNVVRHANCSGGTTVFVMANSSCTSCTSYVFNNVLYDNESNSDKGFSIGGPNANGTFYYYNNTVVTAGGRCMQNGSAGTGTAHYSNFHCISPNAICNFVNGVCLNDGGNVLQTATQANANTTPQFDQYNPSETYAFSPVASTNSTVNTATNHTSGGGLDCTAFPSLCSDVTYTTYDSVNHVAVQRTANPRSAAGSWDAGAYDFSSATQAAAPSCAPGSGNYTAAQTVTCTDPNTGTHVMCYTTNGTTPATNGAGTNCTTGTKYTTTVSISTPVTLAIIAGTSTLTDSLISSYIYTFNIGTPTFSPGAGAYSSTQTVAITSATSGATICYTIDGSAPTENSPGSCLHGATLTNGGTVSVASSQTLKAIGTKVGLTVSAVGSATYTIGIVHVFAQGAPTTSGSNVFTFSYTALAAGDAVKISGICHPSNNAAITTSSLTASGWSPFQRVGPTATGLGGTGFLYGAIAPNTIPATFVFTFTGTGVANCSTFSGYLVDEYSGNDQTGGTTTFNAAAGNGGSTGGCNQAAANITIPGNNEAIHYDCFDAASNPSFPFVQGSNDNSGDVGEYQVLLGGAGNTITPSYINTSNYYIIMGVAIAPSGQVLGRPPSPVSKVLLGLLNP